MTIVIGLGANLGSREAYLRAAIDLLEDPVAGVGVLSTSPIYETEPVGPPQGPYLNAAVRVSTTLEPHALLEHMRRIEALLGRQRTLRFGPRTIDLDLLFMDGRAIHDAELTLPHPRLEERPFALAPLLDVAPELAPIYGDALSRLGGPPPRAGSFSSWPVQGLSEGGEVWGEGLDRHDAAVAAAWAVARTVTPLPPFEATEPAARVPTSDAPEVQAVLAALGRGFVPRHVLLPGEASAASPLLLLGARRVPLRAPRLSRATVRFGGHRFRVGCRLHPSE